MNRSSFTSRFLAGWEPAQLPPRGPDGMIPSPPPIRLSVIEPPSLCEAGPCRNFHHVKSLMDAQGPIDGSGDPVHPQVTRACYPAPGIELELGETPVMRCSRWEPDGEQARLDSIRDAFLKKPEGKAFADKLAAFEQAYVEAAEDNRSVDAPPAFAGSVGELESHLGDADDDLIDEGTVQL